nr:MAG TPA: Putative cell wall binding repeat [Caudoviricetes sp.]
MYIKASKVGEDGIKANTWYTLDANGEFVEVENDE